MTSAATFENHVCSFVTENTENRLGNSKYFVETDRVIRFAYINFGQGRPADEAVEQHPSICSLEQPPICLNRRGSGRSEVALE